nr:MAG TPA: hypothetical protein [Caudoviricetes sp.]
MILNFNVNCLRKWFTFSFLNIRVNISNSL